MPCGTGNLEAPIGANPNRGGCAKDASLDFPGRGPDCGGRNCSGKIAGGRGGLGGGAGGILAAPG